MNGSGSPSGSTSPATVAVSVTPTAGVMSSIVTVPAVGASFTLVTRTTSRSSVPSEGVTNTTYSLFAASFLGSALATSAGAS